MKNRRQFICLLGSAAAAWPLRAWGQQPAMPIIGFIDSRVPEALTERLRGFRQGLKETGYVEGDNASILYRWAENQLDRLPTLADELVRRPVAVIVASGGTPVALRMKAAVTTIPVVFIAAEDPVKLGLVASLARPGGNLTGVNLFSAELVAKRLESVADISAHGYSFSGTGEPGQCFEYSFHVARPGTGCPNHGATNPGAQRQLEP